jgi:hypothetical protein
MVMLRKARLPGPSILVYRTFRRPHTEVDLSKPLSFRVALRKGFIRVEAMKSKALTVCPSKLAIMIEKTEL